MRTTDRELVNDKEAHEDEALQALCLTLSDLGRAASVADRLPDSALTVDAISTSTAIHGLWITASFHVRLPFRPE